MKPRRLQSATSFSINAEPVGVGIGVTSPMGQVGATRARVGFAGGLAVAETSLAGETTCTVGADMRRLLAGLLLLACAGAAQADEGPRPRAIGAQGCPGDPIVPTQVIEGSFPSSLEGSYVMVPFTVPPGTTQVRVKYCWDEPESGDLRHTIDLGLWDARPAGGTWGPKQFRGWGGSSHPDVTITRQGFSSEGEYLARPRGHVPGRTQRGFVPGRIRPGEWAAELGVAAVISQAEGDADGSVRWRVEIALSSDPAFAVERYRRKRYDRRPMLRGAGWYAGDLHVHAEHSAQNDATMREAFEYAFRPLSDGGAGLDFVTLSDYVTTSHWGEIGRHQRAYPGKLIVRSAEVITYRGHTNNHASAHWVDHRTGSVYERAADGALTLLRSPVPPRALFAEIQAHGGFTQINHPTIFPPSVPAFRRTCRGCAWSYAAPETDFARVDAIEIQTGPYLIGGVLPNPFTADAIAFWESALAQGHHIAAVGVSDSHKAGRTSSATESPIGQATTVVYARELSERAIRDAVRAGHTYVKLVGNAGPDLRFEARGPGRIGRHAIMGDTVRGGIAAFTASVLNVPPGGEPIVLHVMKDGADVAALPVAPPSTTYELPSSGPGRYRLELRRGAAILALTTPIWLEP